MNVNIDEDKLHELLSRAVVDFGAVSIAPLVLIGDRLGLYRSLAEHGPMTRGRWPPAPEPMNAMCANGSMRRPLRAMSGTSRTAATMN